MFLKGFPTLGIGVRNEISTSFSSFRHVMYKNFSNVCMYWHFIVCILNLTLLKGKIENVINLIEVTIFFPDTSQLRIESEFNKITIDSQQEQSYI